MFGVEGRGEGEPIHEQTRRRSESSDNASSRTKSTGPHHNARYKAKLCKNWQRDGVCPYYQKCQFAHGEAELLKWNQFRVKSMMQSKGTTQERSRPPGGGGDGRRVWGSSFGEDDIGNIPAARHRTSSSSISSTSSQPIAHFVKGADVRATAEASSSFSDDANSAVSGCSRRASGPVWPSPSMSAAPRAYAAVDSADDAGAAPVNILLSVPGASAPLDVSRHPLQREVLPARLPALGADEMGSGDWATRAAADPPPAMMSSSAPGMSRNRRMSYSDLFRRAQKHQKSEVRPKSLSFGSWNAGLADSGVALPGPSILLEQPQRRSIDDASTSSHVHAIEQISSTPTFSLFPSQ